MDSLDRLLELAGVLVEDVPPTRPDELSREAAERVFARAGAFVSATSSADALKRAWIGLQRRYHEAGSEPDPERLMWINRAYDVLKQGTSVPRDQPPDGQEYTLWGWDGRLLMQGYQVHANPADFPEVARAAKQRLRVGFKVPKGILLQTKREMLLIHFDGHDLNPPADYPCFDDPRRDQKIRDWLTTRR